MDVFKMCKVAGIGLGIAGGLLGAVGEIPDLKEALGDLKSNETEKNVLEDKESE